jgi:hypothetical protein
VLLIRNNHQREERMAILCKQHALAAEEWKRREWERKKPGSH